MKKLAILAGAAALTLAGAASAQGYGYQSNDEAYRAYTQNYQPRNTACERQRDNDKLAGGLVGAVAGGLIGGAIGNNIDGNDRHYHRGYRGYHRGYGRGYRRGHYRRHHHKNDNSDEVVVGALLGAVVGGLAGSSIAESSARDCQTYAAPQPVRRDYGYNSGSYRTDGYRGTAPNYPATYPNTAPVQTYPVSQPRPVTTTTYPRETIYGGPECRTVYRETRLPNGEVVRDPVEACRNGANDEWVIQGSAARY